MVFCFVLLLLLFTLQEKISTMGNKSLFLYLPSEGQETIVFFSVTNPVPFPKYFSEIIREAISFLS